MRLLAFCLHFPQLFPLLSTNRTLVGHTSKFCKSAFKKIIHSMDGFRNLTSKGDHKRSQKWDRLTLLRGDRIRGSTEDVTPCASLTPKTGVNVCDLRDLRTPHSRLIALSRISAMPCRATLAFDPLCNFNNAIGSV